MNVACSNLQLHYATLIERVKKAQEKKNYAETCYHKCILNLHFSNNLCFTMAFIPMAS